MCRALAVRAGWNLPLHGGRENGGSSSDLPVERLRAGWSLPLHGGRENGGSSSDLPVERLRAGWNLPLHRGRENGGTSSDLPVERLRAGWNLPLHRGRENGGTSSVLPVERCQDLTESSRFSLFREKDPFIVRSWTTISICLSVATRQSNHGGWIRGVR